MRLLCLILPLLVSFLSNAESILIRNVTILESTGVEENVSVLIKNGKIESVESIIFIEATKEIDGTGKTLTTCLLYTSPSPRDRYGSRMPSSA